MTDHDGVVREVIVPYAVPVYLPAYPLPRVPARPARRPATPAIGVRYDNPLTVTPRQARQAEPVYWGWGGKLRPDAWQPTPAESPRPKGKDQQ